MTTNLSLGAARKDVSGASKENLTPHYSLSSVPVDRKRVSNAPKSAISPATAILFKSGFKKTQLNLRTSPGSWPTLNHVQNVKGLSKKIKVATT